MVNNVDHSYIVQENQSRLLETLSKEITLGDDTVIILVFKSNF